MCYFSRIIDNPKYKPNKKNGGNPPVLWDERIKSVPIGCKECMECRRQKAREWQVRLLEDIKKHTNGKFITLTFSNEKIQEILKQKPTKTWVGFGELSGYELDNEIATRATRLFLERWRKKYGKSLRHWLVTEIGHNGTENIHLHGIIWTDVDLKTVEEIWNYGFIWKGKYEYGKIINYVNASTVNYITKYVHKVDTDHKYYKSQILTSPGIGKHYTERYDWKLNKYNGDKTIEHYTNQQGYKIAMPIYWRNKRYTDEEREKLWINRIEKKERWVGGERVCIKNGEEEYYKLLEYYKRKNTQLGYGNGEIKWERKVYEEQRRRLMQERRITKENRQGEAPIQLSIGTRENSPPRPQGSKSHTGHIQAAPGCPLTKVKEQTEIISIGDGKWIITETGLKKIR